MQLFTSSRMRGSTRWYSFESFGGKSGLYEGNSLSIAIMISLDSAIVDPLIVATGKPPEGLIFINDAGFDP